MPVSLSCVDYESFRLVCNNGVVTSYSNFGLSLWRKTSTLISIVAAATHIPTSSGQGFLFPWLLPSIIHHLLSWPYWTPVHFRGPPWWWDSLVEEAVAQEAERRRIKEVVGQGVTPKHVYSLSGLFLSRWTCLLPSPPPNNGCTLWSHQGINPFIRATRSKSLDSLSQPHPEECFTNYLGISSLLNLTIRMMPFM